MSNNSHQFAIYVSNLSAILKDKARGSSIVLSDEKLIHRLKHVLRLTEKEVLIFFDEQQHISCSLTDIGSKKTVTCHIESITPNIVVSPFITVHIPLLKKEALEEAIYAAVELGANKIQLVVTEKVQRTWSDKELSRLRSIMIAAAEQSKNFALPELCSSEPITKIFEQMSSSPVIKVCAAINGQPLFTVLDTVQQQKPQVVDLFIGPEGDFTANEYKMLQDHGVKMCALTPTVLRSQQAFIILLAAIRSILR